MRREAKRGARTSAETRRPGTPGPATIVGLVLIALAAAWWSASTDPAAPASAPSKAERYPVLAGLDSETVERVAGLSFDPLWSDAETKARARGQSLGPVLEALGADAPRVALAALLHQETEKRGGISFSRSLHHDRESLSLGWFLREHATPETDAVLLDLVANRDRHFETRLEAAVALCRPGETAVLARLVAVVLDPEQQADLRRQILYRLPRCEAPLPTSLDDLLLQPFDRLDRATALVLAATGRLEAPTLVLQAMEQAKWVREPWGDEPEVLLSLQMAERLTPEAPELAVPAAAVRARVDALADGSSSSDEPELEPGWTDLRTAFTGWVDAHPAVRESAWERAHADYLSSDRRALEMASMNVEHLTSALDEEIDVAAALMAFRETPEVASRELERWDRLARWLRTELAAVTDPIGKLEILQGLLVPRHQVHHVGVDINHLSVVLDGRTGICMTWTCAFVALGDRLGLPLHAVEVPGHIFVRWDDGETVFNFDPNAGGAVISDAGYVAEHGVRTGAGSRDLRNLTRRELVAANLANPGDVLQYKNFMPAQERLRLLRLAVRIDPDSAIAWHNLAWTAAQWGSDHADEVGEAIRRQMPLDELDARDALALARAGLAEEVLRLRAEFRPTTDGEGAAATLAEARALRLLGRPTEALELVRSMKDTDAWGSAPLATEIACLLDLDRDAGLRFIREEDVRLGPDGVFAIVRLHVDIASHYLAEPPDDQAAARMVVSLLSPFGDDRSAAGDDEDGWDGQSLLLDRLPVFHLHPLAYRQIEPQREVAKRRARSANPEDR